ncbi:hypothetical protein PCASD_04504 [Puccinia coronata f. sp. avenae]|uniref:Uncharacterized protein n=1 Tax=Puccinia coronata f. sp. avenae TaxID=200324 RepID=A0A2N5V3C9_9BASI|nr:hypothetical protein PCASD_04504 [Puccinia coronata f. sp. avenae]
MVSLAQLVTLLAVIMSATLADDVGTSKSNSVEEKWLGWGFGSSSFFGMGYYRGFPSWCGTYSGYPISAIGLWNRYPRAWFKGAGDSVARRSISLNPAHLYPRSEEPVSCKAQGGQVEKISPTDCKSAVDHLISQKGYTADCESCRVTLATPTGHLLATDALPEALHLAASQVLKSCNDQAPDAHQNTRRSPADTQKSSQSQFAMIIGKGSGGACK